MIPLAILLIADPMAVTELNQTYYGRVSWFVADKPALGPPETSLYCACRFHYPKLRKLIGGQIKRVLNEDFEVVVGFGKRLIRLQPVDWGPARRTSRGIDISKEAMNMLGCHTDDVVSYYLRPKYED